MTEDTGLQRSAFAWKPVTAVSAIVAIVLGATANQYGYHRDELYFRLLAAHPAWSYVDEPPMTPMLVRASTAIFGDSLWALRIPAILCAAVTVVLVALVCHELGGRRYAQVITAIGVSSTFLLLSRPRLPDRLARHGLLDAHHPLRGPCASSRRAAMVDLGRCHVGVSLYNKQLIALLLIGLAAGLLIAGPRRVLASRWLWASVLIAVVIGLPTLIYQFTHDFPELHMAGAISVNKGGDDRVDYLPFQIVLLGPPLVADLGQRSDRALPTAGVAGDPGVRLGVPHREFDRARLRWPDLLHVRAARALSCGRRCACRAVGRARWPVVGRAWIAAALVVTAVIAAPLALPLVPISAFPSTWHWRDQPGRP